MSTDVPPMPPLFDLLPELRSLAAVTTELEAEAEPGVEADPFATQLGYVAWPRDEAWPWAEPDEGLMVEWRETKEDFYPTPCPQPFFPVLQLRREDAPTLVYPPDTDLLQVLWHCYDHQFVPTVSVRWRKRSALGEVTSPPPAGDLGSWQKNFRPPYLRVRPRASWVLPDIRTTSLDTMRAVARVEAELSRQAEAIRLRNEARNALRRGPEIVSRISELQRLLFEALRNRADGAEVMALASRLKDARESCDPVPASDEPPPPDDYLALGLARGIRVGVHGMCPQLYGNPLPPPGWRHILTIGEDAWPDADCVVPRGGGNVLVFVEDDGQTAHAWSDAWASVSSVEDQLRTFQ